MIATSDLYKSLFNSGAIQEYRVDINGVVYENDSIYTILLSENLFDKDIFTLGSFCSSQLSVKFKVRTEEIPRNATVKFYYRYVNETQASEWILRFTGKITGRNGPAASTTTIEAKDVASNTDVFLDVFPTQIPSYPANARTVVQLIAGHLGLPVVNLADVWSGDIVEYPNELSVIDVLKYIGLLSGGNWTITGDGRLRLVKPITQYTPVGAYSSQSKETLSDMQTISRVTVYWDDEKAFTAGNDTAMTLELDCPWASQATVNGIYSQLAQYYYKGHRANTVYIDPAVELGDYFLFESLGGDERQLGDSAGYIGTGRYLGGSGVGGDPNRAQFCVRMDWTFDGSCSANIESPANNEYIYDDPYNTLMANQFKRKLSLGDSYHGVTIGRADGIQMVWSPDGTDEHATGRFYADLTQGMGFQYRNSYTDQWRDWLYFDKNRRIFMLSMYNTKDEITSLFQISENSIKTFVGDNYETIAHARVAIQDAIQTGYNYTNQTRDGIYNQIQATYVTQTSNNESESRLRDSIATLQLTAQGLSYEIQTNYNSLSSAIGSAESRLNSSISQLKITADKLSLKIDSTYNTLSTEIRSISDAVLASASLDLQITAEQLISTMNATYATKAERASGDASTLTSAQSIVSQKANEILLQVSANYATNSAMSVVRQQADKISWLVQSGTSRSNMTMTPEAIEFIADNVIINGVQIRDGTIDARAVNADFFYGKKYYNSTGKTYLTMDMANGEDSLVVDNQGSKVFSIGRAMQYTQGINFWSYGFNFLGFNYSINKTTFPKGNWDFANANVTNLTGAGGNVAVWG